jgi:hypothetical protein
MTNRHRYSVALRLHILRLLFGRNRKVSLTRRLTLISRRYEIAERTIWRWIARRRTGGVNALRDSLRSDTLTRRTARNVLSISTAAPLSIQLDNQYHISQDAMSGAVVQSRRATKVSS